MICKSSYVLLNFSLKKDEEIEGHLLGVLHPRECGLDVQQHRALLHHVPDLSTAGEQLALLG